MATKMEKTMKEVFGKNKVAGIGLSVLVGGLGTLGVIYVIGLLNYLSGFFNCLAN
tara:strand:+ start:24 stop:188 length:165 start_codon:yes stop_codon:yes gene_type:complete